MEIEFKYMDVKPSKTGLKNGVWLQEKYQKAQWASFALKLPAT